MDSAAEAADYDAMDHRQVNRQFVVDFLAQQPPLGEVLDVGTGTAQIPLGFWPSICRSTCSISPSETSIAPDSNGRSN
jgi:ubiquinone/menaquinone biosynthesis C-methylase UbiE